MKNSITRLNGIRKTADEEKKVLQSTLLGGNDGNDDNDDNNVNKNKKSEDKITIPFQGIVGTENGNLFDKPLDEFDPLKNTDDLPGEDGSDEKIDAIQKRIRDRVKELEKSSEWTDRQSSFGRDPLLSIPLWKSMIMQLKASKPYDSVSDLLLTYVLVLFTSVALSTYLVVIRDAFDTLMPWYINTDFDADYFKSLIPFLPK